MTSENGRLVLILRRCASTLLAAAIATTLSTLAFGQIKPVADRVDVLMKQMTLDEKITLLAGIDSMYTRPIERLGIPQLKFSDGPNGVRCWGKSTAFPAGVLLAATWDPALAEAEAFSWAATRRHGTRMFCSDPA